MFHVALLVVSIFCLAKYSLISSNFQHTYEIFGGGLFFDFRPPSAVHEYRYLSCIEQSTSSQLPNRQRDQFT